MRVVLRGDCPRWKLSQVVDDRVTVVLQPTTLVEAGLQMKTTTLFVILFLN